jgi:hypothetical protein
MNRLLTWRMLVLDTDTDTDSNSALEIAFFGCLPHGYLANASAGAPILLIS